MVFNQKVTFQIGVVRAQSSWKRSGTTWNHVLNINCSKLAIREEWRCSVHWAIKVTFALLTERHVSIKRQFQIQKSPLLEQTQCVSWTNPNPGSILLFVYVISNTYYIHSTHFKLSKCLSSDSHVILMFIHAMPGHTSGISVGALRVAGLALMQWQWQYPLHGGLSGEKVCCIYQLLSPVPPCYIPPPTSSIHQIKFYKSLR